MKNLMHALAGLSVALLLGGCGGGGNGAADASATTAASTTTPTTASTTDTAAAPAAPASTTAAKYAGTWSGCFATGTATSRADLLVITATGPDTATFAFTETNYAQPACAGAASSTSTDGGTVAFSGTKTIGADTVDKATVTQTSGTQKQVFMVSGTTLQFGRQAGDGGTPDANGYPTTFDGNPLTRQ
jgi:hypothetical protein